MRSLSESGPQRQRRTISFVWSPGERLPAGTGGSENYTVGQVRELVRRGIAARVVTTGLGSDDGREGFVGVPFHALASWEEVGGLDDTVVFVSEAPPVATRHRAYQVLHVPPPRRADMRAGVVAATSTRTLIATSRYAARLWADYLDVDVLDVHLVMPFAEQVFAQVERPPIVGRRVLYAGRLSPEKGIYTLLSMLHLELVLNEPALQITVTDAGADKAQGAIIATVVAAHPGVRLVAARTSPDAMAELMVEHDVVVMPSNSQYWHETFGIVSIEAQHAGCRVVASDDGGLPETDCGSLDLVEPDNAEALAIGLLAALAKGPVAAATRRGNAGQFTVTQSVDELLVALDAPVGMSPAAVISHLEALVALPSAAPGGTSEVSSLHSPESESVSRTDVSSTVTIPRNTAGSGSEAAAVVVADAVAEARRARSDAASRAVAVAAQEAAVAASGVRSRDVAAAQRMTELASRARDLVAGPGASANPATLAALMTITVRSAADAATAEAEAAAAVVSRATAETAERVARVVDALDASIEDGAARTAQALRANLLA